MDTNDSMRAERPSRSRVQNERLTRCPERTWCRERDCAMTPGAAPHPALELTCPPLPVLEERAPHRVPVSVQQLGHGRASLGAQGVSLHDPGPQATSAQEEVRGREQAPQERSGPGALQVGPCDRCLISTLKSAIARRRPTVKCLHKNVPIRETWKSTKMH